MEHIHFLLILLILRITLSFVENARLLPHELHTNMPIKQHICVVSLDRYKRMTNPVAVGPMCGAILGTAVYKSVFEKWDDGDHTRKPVELKDSMKVHGDADDDLSA